MHRLPKRPGFYLFSLQCQAQLLTVRSGFFRVNYNAGEPEIRIKVRRGLRLESDTRNIFKQLAVPGVELPVLPHAKVEHLELSATHTCHAPERFEVNVSRFPSREYLGTLSSRVEAISFRGGPDAASLSSGNCQMLSSTIWSENASCLRDAA